MLKLSDCELANLRLECWKRAEDWARAYAETSGTSVSVDKVAEYAGNILAWCLRDRDEPGAGK